MIDIGVPPNICPCKLSWLRELVSCSIWYQLKKKLCLNPFNSLFLEPVATIQISQRIINWQCGRFCQVLVSNYVREKRLLCSNCIVIIQHDLNKVTCRVASPLIVFFPPTHPFGKPQKNHLIWWAQASLKWNLNHCPIINTDVAPFSAEAILFDKSFDISQIEIELCCSAESAESISMPMSQLLGIKLQKLAEICQIL